MVRHAVPADFVVLDGVAFGDVGAVRARAEINAAAQKIGLLRQRNRN